MLLSVVVPCYNEENNIRPFFDITVSVLSDIIGDTEVIFVNDGSKDNTVGELKKLTRENVCKIKVVNF